MPKAKLTRDYIRDIKPSEKVFEVWDTELKGLALRVWPSGRMVFLCQFDRGRRINVGRADVLAVSDARRIAGRILSDYANGIDPLADRRREKTSTLRDFLDGPYSKWVQSHYGDGQRVIDTMKASFPDLLDMRLDAITPWHVEKWRAQRSRNGIKASTINRQLNPLKALMRRAVEFEAISVNPLEGAVKLKREDPTPKVRFLDDVEDARLMAVLDARDERMRQQRASANAWRAQRGYELLPSLEDGYADHLKPLVIISLNTGMRRGELFNLRWRDVDLARATLTVEGEGAKSGETRHIPLNAAALSTLKAWGEGLPADHVFPGENGARLTTIQTAWEKALSDAEIEDFRWHDLRHTFASRLVMAGVDLNTVRELLGHSDMKMTLRYAHLAQHVKADAVSRLVRPVEIATSIEQRRAANV